MSKYFQCDNKVNIMALYLLIYSSTHLFILIH